MASNSLKTLSACSLLQKRANFNTQWFNSFRTAKKAAHQKVDDTQAAFDKELHKRQIAIIEHATELAGKPDIVQDPALIEHLRTFSTHVGRVDGQPVYEETLCECKPHESLALLRTGNLDGVDLTHNQKTYLAETALNLETEIPSDASIIAAELEVDRLTYLLADVKNNVKKLSLYDPNDEAELAGAKTYEIHEQQQGEVIDISKGMSQEQINRHSEAYGKRSGLKPMTRRKAEQLMRDSTRDLSGKAGSQDLNKPPMSPSEMALHIYRQNGVVPDGYQIENDSKGQRLVKL